MKTSAYGANPHSLDSSVGRNRGNERTGDEIKVVRGEAEAKDVRRVELRRLRIF